MTPKTRLDYLLDKQTEFETAAAQIVGTVREAEVGRLLDAATKAGRKKAKRPLGPCAVRMLWNECGDAGRALLVKNAAACDTPGLRTLVWLAEGLTAESAAAAVVEAGLSDLPAADLLRRQQASAPEQERHPHSPDAVIGMLDIARRFHSFDSESDRVPPDYPGLLRDLCDATAGSLRFEDATVKDDDRDNVSLCDIESFEVEFRCNGTSRVFEVPNKGDWFDPDSVFETLTDVLKSIGNDERFFHVAGNGQCDAVVFGPPAVIEDYAGLFAVPLITEGGGPDEDDAFRKACIGRVKRAVKKASSRAGRASN